MHRFCIMKVPSWFLLLRALCEHWCEQVHTPSINTIWNINCGEHCRPYKTSIGTKWKYWAPNFRQHWQKEASYQFWCMLIRLNSVYSSNTIALWWSILRVRKQTNCHIYIRTVCWILVTRFLRMSRIATEMLVVTLPICRDQHVLFYTAENQQTHIQCE